VLYQHLDIHTTPVNRSEIGCDVSTEDKSQTVITVMTEPIISNETMSVF